MTQQIARCYLDASDPALRVVRVLLFVAAVVLAAVGIARYHWRYRWM